MRCFIAVDLPNNVKQYLKSLQNEFNIIFGKPVETENLHLTLKFFEDLNEAQVNLVKKSLRKISLSGFKVSLGSLGVFPSREFPRILWVSLEPTDKVIELKEQIDFALKDMDLGFDKKFKSHITLMRIKSIKDKNRFFQILDRTKLKHFEFDIDSFVFKKSVLKNTGLEYSVLDKFDLK